MLGSDRSVILTLLKINRLTVEFEFELLSHEVNLSRISNFDITFTVTVTVTVVDGSRVSKSRTASRSTCIVDRLVKTREISLV